MTKYQNKGVLRIEVHRDDWRELAWEGIDGLEYVDRIEDESYKDLAPTTTILYRASDNTFWAFNWQKYTSHYGSGDHYFDDPYIYRVSKHEEVVTKTVITWPLVKE